MPSPGKEVPVHFTGFLGTNVSVDPATLPHTVLQRSENFVPTNAFTLARRPGIRATGNIIGFAEDIPAAIRFTYQRVRYTYLVANIINGAFPDLVAVSINDGPFAVISNGYFDAAGIRTYDFALYGGFLYCSNGINPVKQIAVGGAAEDLTPLETWTDVTPSPTVDDDPGARLLTGTYSYCWAVYDGTRWQRRSEPRTVKVNAKGDRALVFTSPTVSYLVEAGSKFHLFVAPVNLPIEYAHDQTPEGVGEVEEVVVRGITVEQTPVPMVGYITRKGRYTIAHRGRVWIAHDSTFPAGVRRVYATNVILPGYEQLLFDQGRFFPANAVINLPDTITGMGIMSLTGTQRSPNSPLAIFTQTQTWLFLGDILDDPSADLVQRSDRIGCTSHKSIASTPYGLCFVGLESVYLLTPSGEIIDIGWPIRTEIQSITPAMQPRILGIYHDGFYKIAISVRGKLVNDTMWYLDLRRGLPSVPSWWGPHTIAKDAACPQSWCIGIDEATTDERLFGYRYSIESEFDIGTKDHDITFAAVAITGLVDLNRPFDRKLATRARIVAKPGDTTAINATVIVDEQFTQNFGNMDLIVEGAEWDVAEWDVAEWGTAFFQEGTALAEADRPRGQAFALKLTHNSPQTLEIRHAELALLPIVRTMKENYS